MISESSLCPAVECGRPAGGVIIAFASTILEAEISPTGQQGDPC